MANISFNTESGQTVARELMILYLNTGTSEAPVWSALGKRVEESWSTHTETTLGTSTMGLVLLL